MYNTKVLPGTTDIVLRARSTRNARRAVIGPNSSDPVLGRSSSRISVMMLQRKTVNRKLSIKDNMDSTHHKSKENITILTQKNNQN